LKTVKIDSSFKSSPVRLERRKDETHKRAFFLTREGSIFFKGILKDYYGMHGIYGIPGNFHSF